MVPVSNGLVIPVAVCAVCSRLLKVTLVPGAMLILAGGSGVYRMRHMTGYGVAARLDQISGVVIQCRAAPVVARWDRRMTRPDFTELGDSMTEPTMDNGTPGPGVVEQLARDDVERKRFLKMAGRGMGGAAAATGLAAFIAACGSSNSTTSSSAPMGAG